MATKLTPLKQQRGSALLEALIAILIFSMGIIALMGLQAASIKNSIDAKYRADASYLANQIIGQMWVDRASLDSYKHNPTVGTICAPTGAASTYAKVTDDWLPQIAATLPGATSAKQQISVTTPLANTRQVTVTLCWKGPQEPNYHNFVATAQINTP
ncbi:MAG: type IV pilus modification PilV family protein [Sulfuricella sp.]